MTQQPQTSETWGDRVLEIAESISNCCGCSTDKLTKEIPGIISEERKRAQEELLKYLYKQAVDKVNGEENIWILRWIKQTVQSLGLSIKE